MTKLLPLAIAVLLLAAAAGAQPAACDGPEFHAFDFWIGHWRVESAAGAVQGHNTISRVAGGCGLREEWAAQSGGTGTSLNYHDPGDGGRVRQFWEVSKDGGASWQVAFEGFYVRQE